MVELESDEYCRVADFADRNSCVRVYPLSIVEHVQDGRIFVDSPESIQSVFFWHRCGFGYVSGSPTREFLSEIDSLFWTDTYREPGRLVLLLNDPWCESCFQDGRGLAVSQRHEFRYIGNPSAMSAAQALPDGFVCMDIDEELFAGLSGRVVPSMFWSSASEFLEKGKGFCLLHDGACAAWSFSSAVSHDEIDIGVETSEDFRRRGLAGVVARRMAQYVLQTGRRPVWQCQVSNEGSRRTAEKIGFQITKTHSVFRKADL